MDEDRRYDNRHRAKCIRKDMEKYTVHVFISVGVRMPVIVTTVRVAMSVMGMIKRHYANEIDCKACCADNQQLPYPVHLAA